MTKKSKQKFKFLDNNNSSKGEIKNIFHHIKGLLAAIFGRLLVSYMRLHLFIQWCDLKKHLIAS